MQTPWLEVLSGAVWSAKLTHPRLELYVARGAQRKWGARHRAPRSVFPLEDELLRLADLDGLHARFGFLSSLEGDRTDLGDSRGGRLLVHDGALLGRCILHHVVLGRSLSVGWNGDG